MSGPDRAELERRVALAAQPAERASALRELAAALRRDEPARALATYEEALAITCAQPEVDQRALAETRYGIAICYRTLGRTEPALSVLSQALPIFRSLGEQERLMAAQLELGAIYQTLSEFPAALEQLLEALALAEQIESPRRQAEVLLRIGFVYSDAQRPAEALPYYDRALALCRQIGDRSAEARTLNSYCVDSALCGRIEEALAYGWESHRIYSETGHRYGQGVALGSIGEAYSAAGRYGQALEALRSSLELLSERDPSHRSYESIQLRYQIGVALLRLGHLADAQGELDRALELALASGIRQVAAQCHARLAELHELRGDARAALPHLRRHLALREQIFSEEGERRLHNLEVLHRTRAAQAEAERQRELREEERRVFEQLSQIQREFFSAATHDLKNPLLSLSLSIELLEGGAASPDELRELLGDMRHSVRRMSRLIGDILDLAKLEAGRALTIGQATVGDLLRATARNNARAAEQRAVALEIAEGAGGLTVDCDQALLRRALDNLLDNAIKYSPDGGRVLLSAEQQGQQLIIRVSDRGLGIPPEALPHLFERFYRVDRPEQRAIVGSGLGLAIVRTIVEQHGGSVWAESEPGSGSTFSIRIPLAARRGAPPPVRSTV